jgi:hypothetical protein
MAAEDEMTAIRGKMYCIEKLCIVIMKSDGDGSDFHNRPGDKDFLAACGNMRRSSQN